MDRSDESLVVGRHAVAAALASRPELAQELLIAGGEKAPAVQAILQAARAAGVKLRRVEAAVLDRLAIGAAHQGVALRLAMVGYAQAEDIIAAAAAAGPAGLVLVADHIQDPHNLGALIRSAAAAGAQGLIMPKDRACPLTPAVAKAAAGALAALPVARVTNLSQALDRLKEAGLWVLAAATKGAPPPWDLDLRLPLALVLGGEHKGVGQRLLAAADLQASIPLAAGVESLNLSVAAGVLLFEIVRQRAGANPASM